MKKILLLSTLLVLVLCLATSIVFYERGYFNQFDINELAQQSLIIGTSESKGSGFPISNTQIITNAHVVINKETSEPYTDIHVYTSDRRFAFNATLVAYSTDYDIAVLEIPENEIVKAYKIGDSDKLKIGQTIWTLGAPHVFARVASKGVIGDLRATIGGAYGYIEIDASLFSGNSGGPLLDEQGRVIGINNQIFKVYDRFGFAMPINESKEVWERLIAKKSLKLIPLELLINTSETNPDGPIREFNGALIKEIRPGGINDQLGLKVGDRITKINGFEIIDVPTLIMVMNFIFEDESVSFEVVRDGETLQLDWQPTSHK